MRSYYFLFLTGCFLHNNFAKTFLQDFYIGNTYKQHQAEIGKR